VFSAIRQVNEDDQHFKDNIADQRNTLRHVATKEGCYQHYNGCEHIIDSETFTEP
jgi:hypothetical protein